jgi:acyl-CoA thioesterase
MSAATRFATDTAVEPLGDGRWSARIDRGWWIERGPNGGYLAAVVLRAVQAELDDASRPPRSLTLHYFRPPVEGPATVEVEVLRQGRSLTNARARLTQGDRVCIEALVALAEERPGPAFADEPPPGVARPEDLPAPPPSPIEIPIRDRFVQRHAVGAPPFTGADRAETGGWIRLEDDQPVDHAVVAALTDAWVPAVFSRAEVPTGVPTVDLTIHFRNQPPQRPGWCLVRFTTATAAEGYLEEDGQVWSEDGVLLAQSRQLAVMLPPG